MKLPELIEIFIFEETNTRTDSSEQKQEPYSMYNIKCVILVPYIKTVEYISKTWIFQLELLRLPKICQVILKIISLSKSDLSKIFRSVLSGKPNNRNLIKERNRLVYSPSKEGKSKKQKHWTTG